MNDEQKVRKSLKRLIEIHTKNSLARANIHILIEKLYRIGIEMND